MPRNLRGSAAQLNPFSNNQRLGVLGAGFYLAAYKIADQDVNTSTVLVNDLELSVGLNFTGYWDIELDANILIANAAHNIRYAFSQPDGLVMVANVTRGRGWLVVSGTAPQEDQITNLTPVVTGGTTNAWTSLRIRFGAQVSSPGSLTFQFAQNVSGASNTRVQAGSKLKATYLANNLGS